MSAQAPRRSCAQLARLFTVRDRSRCPRVCRRVCRREEGEVRHGERHDGELIHPDTQFDVHQILGAVT